MSSHEFTEPHQDDYASDSERVREDEYLLSLDNRERVRLDRLAEHSPVDPKPAKRVKRTEAPKPDAEWRERIFDRDQGCIVHVNPAHCSEGFCAHHIVAQQELRRTHPEALWNHRSGVCLCGKAHRQYHAGMRLLFRDDLPSSVDGYLESLGYGEYIARRYPSRQETAA